MKDGESDMPENVIIKDAIITINDLHFARNGKPVLRGMNLAIPRGKVTAIMGPSGTGKTTLLRLIGGEIKPDRGRVEVDGLSVPELSQKELYKLRARMGVLFQQGALFTDLNIYENVAFPLREHTQLSEDMLHDLVLLQLEAVGLRGAAKLHAEQLSGGMARRAALARATILGPEIMLYDEPFSGQDPIARGVLIQLIRQLNDALNMTSVVISHDVSETAHVADYVYIIFQGEVIGQGTPDDLLQADDPKVHQFIHGLPDGAVSFHHPAENMQEEVGL